MGHLWISRLNFFFLLTYTRHLKAMKAAEGPGQDDEQEQKAHHTSDTFLLDSSKTPSPGPSPLSAGSANRTMPETPHQKQLYYWRSLLLSSEPTSALDTAEKERTPRKGRTDQEKPGSNAEEMDKNPSFHVANTTIAMLSATSTTPILKPT